MSTAQLSRLRSPRAAALSLAIIGAGVSVYTFSRSVAADTGEPPKMFARFGPKALKVVSSEAVNHNTKKLRFEFPRDDAVSGLSLTCKHAFCF
jgi:cytochrome-b5 reductase